MNLRQIYRKLLRREFPCDHEGTTPQTCSCPVDCGCRARGCELMRCSHCRVVMDFNGTEKHSPRCRWA